MANAVSIGTLTPRHTSGHLNQAQYQSLYAQSINHPEAFWGEQATRFISWYSTWSQVLSGDFAAGEARWFKGATLNACYNCVDRHLPQHANKIALYWEANQPDERKVILMLAYMKQYVVWRMF